MQCLPAILFKEVKFSVRYCTVAFVKWRYRCDSTVDKPSFGRQDTWKSWENTKWGDIGLIIKLEFTSKNNQSNWRFKIFPKSTCNIGTLSGGKICLMRSSVHLGLSRLPMFVTLKLRKLLDFDRKWVRLVRLMCDKRST